MALRSLDNALPMAPQERPKKQPKVSGVPDLAGVNDENKPPVPEAAIDYVLSENLKCFDDPDAKIQGLGDGLESKDWTKVCESLNDARRFAIHHPDLLQPILDMVMLIIVKAMKNPRSALIKTSIMASSDIFTAFGDGLLESPVSDAFEPLLLQLLLKASQDKKFVCEEADKALKAMVESLTPLPLLRKLQTYASHSNPRVRAKAAVSVSHCISKMGLDGMKEFGLASTIQTAAHLLNDRLPEAREAARGIVMSLHKALIENEEEKVEVWENFCQANLTAIHAQAMVKLVSS